MIPRFISICALVLCAIAAPAVEDVLIVPHLSGRPGGRLIYGQRTQPKTLNPVFAADPASREIVNRMMADLVHINRATLKTEPALAKSCNVSADGLRYVLDLRRGIRFSDGHPFDADDVIFTFQVFLDPAVHSSQRAFWILDGKPVSVHKLGPYKVEFVLPRVNAVGDRMFDGVPILPRHLLESAYREGKLDQVWGLRTPPSEIAGLGPFRLREFVPGQRVVLERNPYYWKSDAHGHRLPYLAELTFGFASGETIQVMRLQNGETDLVERIAAKDYAALARDADRRGFMLADAGGGFDFSVLAFNLNDNVPAAAPWRRTAFRKAVAEAIDRNAMVRLVYQGYATALATPVAAGNALWIDRSVPPPVADAARARSILAKDGFRWSPDGALLDPAGRPVAFSIAVPSSNPERGQMATLIQDDLKKLGMQVNVVPLEFHSLVERVTRTFDWEACILALPSPDADPNVDMAFWTTGGQSHIWSAGRKTPSTPWEAEIDRLMRLQMVTPRYADRKRLFDRVQEIAVENMPVVPLVSTHVLVGARKGLGNFHPAALEPSLLWNVDELYWEGQGGARR